MKRFRVWGLGSGVWGLGFMKRFVEDIRCDSFISNNETLNPKP